MNQLQSELLLFDKLNYVFNNKVCLIEFCCYFFSPAPPLSQNQDKWKYNGPMNSNPMNSNTISAIGGGISMQQSQQQSHQVPPNTIGKPPSLPQMLNPSLHQQMQNQQDRSRQPTVSINIFLFFFL